MKTVAAFVAALVLLVFAGSAMAAPNVILIVTDDQRSDTLGYMPTVQDELVGKGVTFTNAFVVNPVCCPSRSTILTGLYSHTHGVWGIASPFGGFPRFGDSSTLPVWLDAIGYETMLAGKYLNGYNAPAYVPPGWHRWFAYTSRPNQYFDYAATDGSVDIWFGSEAGDYATDVLAARAVDFIRRAGPEPFFLYFAPKAPHLPYTPAPRHEGAFSDLEPWRPPSLNEPDVSDKPAHIRAASPLALDVLATYRRKQLGSLLAVDEAIAGMLAALRETGKLADTLIVFTSRQRARLGRAPARA